MLNTQADSTNCLTDHRVVLKRVINPLEQTVIVDDSGLRVSDERLGVNQRGGSRKLLQGNIGMLVCGCWSGVGGTWVAKLVHRQLAMARDEKHITW
jgi:hypothetical protein